jgi:ribonuclease BN (tRNA processing enzyme)
LPLKGAPLKITVVGSGTVVPRLERRQSCVVVRAGGQMLVFDLGSGALRGMLRSGLDPLSVDRMKSAPCLST